MKLRKKPYLELFISTFMLSACVFGGGYVIVPLMRKRFVDKLHWIDESEMLDLISIAQSSPGPVAVNASVMVGYRVAGAAGAIITALGTVLPSFAIISVISFFYRLFGDNAFIAAILNGMRSGVAAVICSVVVDFDIDVLRSKSLISALLIVGVFIAVYFFKVSVLYIIPICASIGLIAGKAGLLPKRAAKKGSSEKK